MRRQFDRFWRKCGWISFALPAVVIALVWWVQWRQPAFDLVILNGRIFDGARFLAAGTGVGIRKGVITRIGVLYGAQTRRIIDASGQIVSPGFIDTHVHVENNIGSGPFRAPNFVAMGVTTVVTGNCGTSRLNIRSLLEHIDKRRAQVNVATLVGHNSVREHVIGKALRPATIRELEDMRELVDRGMSEGALGFSTGLEYAPGISAETEEVVDLARAAARWKGLYATHMRDEAAGFWPSLKESVAVAKRAGVHLQISHMKIASRKLWPDMRKALDWLEQERKTGLKITQDAYAYSASSTSTDLLLPPEFRGPAKAAIRDPEKRRALIAGVLRQLDQRGFENFGFARVASFADPDYRGKRIPDLTSQQDRIEWVGEACKTRPDLRQELEVLVRLIERGGAQMIYEVMNEDNVKSVLSDPYTMIGTDSAVRSSENFTAHPRGYGNFPKILSEHEKLGISKEHALRKMTSLPAETFGIQRRGWIRKGFAADLVIFDPERIKDNASYDDPLAKPVGISYVIVNGGIVKDIQGDTKELPGQAIRRAPGPPAGPLPPLGPSLQLTAAAPTIIATPVVTPNSSMKPRQAQHSAVKSSKRPKAAVRSNQGRTVPAKGNTPQGKKVRK